MLWLVRHDLSREDLSVKLRETTHFGRGKAGNEDGIHGVGFTIHTTFLCQFPNLLTGVKESLKKLYFPPSGCSHAILISACTPTLTSCEEIQADGEKLFFGQRHWYTKTGLMRTLRGSSY